MINVEKRLKRSEILEKSWQVFNSIEYENQSILDSQITTFLSRFYNSYTNKMKFNPSNANGHITLNTPVLVRSLKLSNVESSQYLDGWPPGNTGCCWLNSTFLYFMEFVSCFSQDFVSCFHKIFQPFLWQNSGNLEEKDDEKRTKKSWKEKSKKKGRKPTASSVPRRSPIQVLTGLNVA